MCRLSKYNTSLLRSATDNNTEVQVDAINKTGRYQAHPPNPYYDTPTNTWWVTEPAATANTCKRRMPQMWTQTHDLQ